MRTQNGGNEASAAPKPQPKAETAKSRERTLLGVADSSILFVTGIRLKLVKAPNGEEVLYEQPYDVPLKLTSTPIGGYAAGGGSAFTITERWCKKQKLDYDKTIRSIEEQEGYGLRFVFEDDERKDETNEGKPMFARIMAQIRYRHQQERSVQAEAYETGIMHSEALMG